jgi:hypothetical protein
VQTTAHPVHYWYTALPCTATTTHTRPDTQLGPPRSLHSAAPQPSSTTRLHQHVSQCHSDNSSLCRSLPACCKTQSTHCSPLTRQSNTLNSAPNYPGYPNQPGPHAACPGRRGQDSSTSSNGVSPLQAVNRGGCDWSHSAVSSSRPTISQTSPCSVVSRHVQTMYSPARARALGHPHPSVQRSMWQP